MVSIKDIAWIAGLFEGEASFYTYTKKRNKGASTSYPEFTIQSVDSDIIQRVAKIMNVVYISNVVPYGSTKQHSFKLRRCGSKAIEWMMTIYSLMGKRRQAKLKQVIIAWKVSIDGRRRARSK